MLAPHKMREIVFHLLYSADFAPESQEEMIPLLMQQHQVTKKSIYTAISQAMAIRAQQQEIDRRIAIVATAYEFERIPSVERNLLRLGVYELLFSSSVPPKVAISEAMRLARKFGSTESARFINAILDALYKKKETHAI